MEVRTKAEAVTLGWSSKYRRPEVLTVQITKYEKKRGILNFGLSKTSRSNVSG